MHVAGRDDRLVQLFAQGHNGAVIILDGLDGIDLAVAHHEFIVAQGLDFKKIVIIGNAQQFVMAFSGHDRPVKFL